jgi:hypothetical protein
MMPAYSANVILMCYISSLSNREKLMKYMQQSTCIGISRSVTTNQEFMHSMYMKLTQGV